MMKYVKMVCPFLLLALLGNYQARAQKVKYKDLYLLLSSGKYEEGEPFLKGFLSDPKNANHPNANFYMGVVYQNKAISIDLLKSTATKMKCLDSALLFYNKSISLINEKEVKKNDDFYQAFSRRDLRTGKFGIKLSDVHLDIENRINVIKGQTDNVANAKAYFDNGVLSYEKAMSCYQVLAKTYPSVKKLWLQTDKPTMAQLDSTISYYSNMVSELAEYKKRLSKITKPGYNQDIQEMEIKAFGTDGMIRPDFLSNEVKVWDYAGWANRVKDTYENELIPLIDSFITLNEGIGLSKKKLLKDSVIMVEGLQKNNNMEELARQFLKFDNYALPVLITELNLADLDYHHYKISNKGYVDSSNVYHRLAIVDTLLQKAGLAHGLSKKLEERDFTEELKDHKRFIQSFYRGLDELQVYSEESLKKAEEEILWTQGEVEKEQERGQWAIYKKDSIPLFFKELSNAHSSQHFMFFSDTLSSGQIFTNGLYYDKYKRAKGYFALVPNNRNVLQKVTYPIAKELSDVDGYGVVKSLGVFDKVDGYYIFNYFALPSTEGIKGQLIRVSVGEKLLWSKKIKLSSLPQSVEISDSGTLLIKYKNAGTNSTDEKVPTAFLIDKNGTLKGEK